MKNSNLSTLTVRALFLFFLAAISFRSFGAAKQQYYEIRIYQVADKSQEAMVDAFLKDAYIPALHRAGISKVGVFKPVETDTASFGKLVYLFIPFRTMEEYTELAGILEKDKDYLKAGMSFTDAPFDKPPYSRQQSILLKAFMNMPQFVVPNFKTSVNERIYELRSYESATEAKAAKKIEMFNQGGEIDLFQKLKFNAVFYGEALAGDQKPNLMYMTTFSDIKTHDELWKSFGASPEWKKLSGLEEYKNTVSKSHIYLLHPTSYSDF